MSVQVVSQRYVAWLRRHAAAVIGVHVVVVALAIYLVAFHLPLFADFSYLLPQDAPAVRDLRQLEARVKTTDTVLVVITAQASSARQAAAAEMARAARALPRDLVEQVEDDDAQIRDFLRAHRPLFVPLKDLQAARDALRNRIATLNPLYINLDEEPQDHTQLDDLRSKRREAEARLSKSSHVSDNGMTAMIEVRTGFRGTDVDHGENLLAALGTARDAIMARHAGVEIGFTGGIVTAVAEHDAILSGMLASSIVTTLLVALVLALYFRSATLLALLIVTLVGATATAFGAAAITVGHLNAATAFLGAIIAGNGVNYGILLIARYLEERRRSDVDDALAAAIVGTLRPTAVASLGASIAYGSLAATSFRGFADFAIIGAIGMTLCWFATYGLLPALMLVFGRTTRIYNGTPIVGGVLATLFGFRRSHIVVVCGALVGVAATVAVARYVVADPFEYDIKQLRSEGDAAVTARNWMAISDRNFGRGYAGRTFIAASRLDQVPLIVAALRAKDAGVPPDQQTIGSINSILDVVPEHQAEKLRVLADIRKLLDNDAISQLSDSERAELAELRPPDGLQAITTDELPQIIKDKLTEKDGRIGYLISIRPANRLNEWNGHDLIRFAQAVRKLDLPDGEVVTTSGASVIFADIVFAIERDGPIVTGIASLGLIVMVVLLVGRNWRAASVLIATASGSLLMVAACALLGLKVNFLDFVALPITLGLGIDYAINVAHRHDHEEFPDPIRTLRTSGSAVFVCSLTTMIGYGSLLVSDNLAIRGFGTASLIGEVTCVLTALILVPALLSAPVKRRALSQPRQISR